jgi:tetratricopeptide (TPR) repeat protein
VGVRPLAILLTLTLLSAPLAAQEDAADESSAGEASADDRNALAREHYDAGKTHYTVGEFEQALERFAAAYKLRPAPLLLFNMGQCHRQLGRHERAVFFFEGFLRDASPDDANRALVEELLDEEKAAVAAAELEIDKEPAPKPEPEPEPERPVVEPEPEPTVAAADEPAPITEQWWFWTAVAGGAAVVVAATGVTIAAVALSQPSGPDEGSLGVVDLR